MTDLPVPDENPEVPIENLKNPTLVKPDILASLPEYVKHPKNYLKIQKALLETLTCGKLHSDPIKATECSVCTANMMERRKLMEKFGFKTPAMYMEWRKRHEEIKKRVPLEMYNKIVNESD